jgi:redox-sensitive bicupin YhaK (pirin superfamily)
MSGPVDLKDVVLAGQPRVGTPGAAVAVTESRVAEVGSVQVRRALPNRGRRSVGPWCFVDHFGPIDVTRDQGIDIGPHPHIGLQTVTWLISGEVLHRDSLGSEQVIRPGQLNLMTAGLGVAHAEEATGSYSGPLHGVQLWVAQPSGTRSGPASFEHHSHLPVVDLDNCEATILVGRFGGQVSPVRRDTEQLGVGLLLRRGGTTVPLDMDSEYALVVTEGAVAVGKETLRPGHLAYLGTGRDELHVSVLERSRAMMLGGAPFPDRLVMWWNFVARTREEIDAAYRDWADRSPRFGDVVSGLPRVEVEPPAWSVRQP